MSDERLDQRLAVVSERTFRAEAVKMAQFVFVPQFVVLFFLTRSEALDGKRPMDLFHEQQAIKVCNLLAALAEGVFL